MHETDEDDTGGSDDDAPSNGAEDTRFARKPSDGKPEPSFLALLECLAEAGEAI